MTNAALFQRFIEQSPITVMLRATLERLYNPAALDQIFQTTAKRQYEGELLFSTVVNLLATVVWRQRKSVSDAYLHAQEKLRVSVRSVYNKLNGTEPEVCRALVRKPAGELCEVVDALQQRRPCLAGYRTRIVDGNHLTSTQHRLSVLRTTRSGPLPGQALAILDPDRMLVTDLICCEDGEAQERSLTPELIDAAQEKELWIADRNFCTTRILFGLASRGACFLIRQHRSTLSWEEETPLEAAGKCATGRISRQTLHLQDGAQILKVRRVVVKLKQPTTNGDTEISLLTNVPRAAASDRRVAELYLKRWTIENAFQEIEQAFRSEIDTLGYPGAALLGFAIAVMTYNVLSVVKWAIALKHSKTIQREELSGYYLSSIVASDYGGMMIALPPSEWTKRYAQLTIKELAKLLSGYAQYVQPDRYRKKVRGEKKPRPKRTRGNVYHHVSTAQLLALQK